MKTPFIALVGAMLALAVPATSQDILVSREGAAIEQVSRELDRNLLRAEWPRRQPTGEGFVSVRFLRDADGRATDVTLYRRSGSSSVDRLARRAVAGLGRAAPLPRLGGPRQVYQANIIVAHSEEAHADLAVRMARLEKARLADPRERAVFAFAAGPRKAE